MVLLTFLVSQNFQANIQHNILFFNAIYSDGTGVFSAVANVNNYSFLDGGFLSKDDAHFQEQKD